jgi:flavin-dependent dehydrogenase
MGDMASPMRTFDVVILGASLAGSAAAIELGRAGLRTLLIDKGSFPRRKACGEGFSQHGAQYLNHLGISPEVCRNGMNEFLGYRIVTYPSDSRVPRELVARTPYPSGWGLSREVLDRVLVERALQLPLVEACFGRAVRALRRRKTSWVVTEGVNEFEARYVVVATGASLPGFTTPYVLQKYAGSRRVGYSSVATIVTGEPSRFVTLVPSDQGEVYVTSLGDGRVNVSIVGTRTFVHANKCSKVLERMLRERLGLHLVFESSGIGAAHFEARHASTDPLLYLVGDSRESFDPICGMGMSHALATGIAAAHFIGRSCEGSIATSRALAAYHRCQERMARGIRLYSQGVQTLVKWYRRAPLCFAPLSPSLAGRCVAALQSSIKPLRSFDAPHVSMQESCAEQLTNS